MVAARLSTALWIGSCIFRANKAGVPIVVLHKGDATAGAVLIKLNKGMGEYVVLAETRNMRDERGWFAATGPKPVDEAAADGYIERSRKRDGDLWVIEFDGQDTRAIFDEPILDS